MSPTDNPRRGWAWAAAVALAWVLLVQAGQCRVDLNLGDEGFLWYGVQRTAAGEWAIRDFQAYDPGRYLALAGWAKLVRSDGIVALRLGLAAIEWTALVAGTRVVRRATASRAVQAVACGVLATWMGPRHKLPDAAAAVWVTLVLVRLAERPDRRRCLAAGATVGLLWLVGINHAVYAAAATAAVLLGSQITAFGQDRSLGRAVVTNAVRLGWTTGGVILGALPMLLILSLVPGYAAAYGRLAILPLVRMGATNLTVAVPWPWAAHTWPAIAVGIGFVLLPALAVLAAIAWVRRPSPVLLGTAATAAVWSHHAFARADLSHLSQAIGPTVLLAVVLPTVFAHVRLVRAAVWTPVLAVTVATVPALTPMFNAGWSAGAVGRWATIGGERLYVPTAVADVCLAGEKVADRTPAGQTDLFVPYVPGLYAVARRRCPIYESYPLFPATAAEQRQAIADLRRHPTAWVMYWPYRIDGRDDLGFANTDPLVWRFVTDHYAPAGTAGDAVEWRRR